MANFSTPPQRAVPFSKPKREPREDALARILYLTWSHLVPDDLSRLGDKKTIDLAGDLSPEVTFWLFLQPAGEKPVPTSAEARLGLKEYTEALVPYLKAKAPPVEEKAKPHEAPKGAKPEKR